MRKRLKNFLPVALIVLIVQIFAPIGAWSAANIAADPLTAAVVCHGNGTSGSDQSDQTTHNRVHDGCCLVCSVLHTGAPVDPRSPDLIVAFDRNAAPIIWHSFVSVGAIFDGGYPARAPPSLYFLTEQTFEQPVQVFAPISAIERAGQSLVSG